MTPHRLPSSARGSVRATVRRFGTVGHVQAGSARAGEDYHLPDGPEARARNARMVAYTVDNRFGPHATVRAADVLAEEVPS